VLDLAARHLREQEALKRVLLALSALGVAVAGILEVMFDKAESPPVLVLAAQVAGLAIGALIPVALAVVEKQPADLIVEIGALDHSILNLQTQLEQSKEVANAYETEMTNALERLALYGALISVLDATLAPDPQRRPQTADLLLTMLEALQEQKGALMGVGPDEHWSFSVYLYDGQRRELECVACRRWRRDAEIQPHRSWRQGEGHVGRAFERGTELVCGDTSAPDVRGFFAAPQGKDKADDPDLYRSIAAIPIASNFMPDQPYGVIVASSDVAGRFSSDSDEPGFEAVGPLRDTAEVMANAIASLRVWD
jgi:hypothetical protein